MKRLVTTFLICAAFSTPALADSPAVRQMNSFDWVVQLYNSHQERMPAVWNHKERCDYDHPRHHKGHDKHGHHHHPHHGHHHKDHPKDNSSASPMIND
jgi:hypothetical protein